MARRPAGGRRRRRRPLPGLRRRHPRLTERVAGLAALGSREPWAPRLGRRVGEREPSTARLAHRMVEVAPLRSPGRRRSTPKPPHRPTGKQHWADTWTTRNRCDTGAGAAPEPRTPDPGPRTPDPGPRSQDHREASTCAGPHLLRAEAHDPRDRGPHPRLAARSPACARSRSPSCVGRLSGCGRHWRRPSLARVSMRTSWPPWPRTCLTLSKPSRVGSDLWTSGSSMRYGRRRPHRTGAKFMHD